MSTKNLFEIQSKNQFLTIRFFDFVDASTVEKIRDATQNKIPSQAKNFIIDLKNVNFIDSHGVGFFVSLLKQAHKNNGRLFFTGANGQPASILEMVGFTGHLVGYADSEAEAREKISQLV